MVFSLLSKGNCSLEKMGANLKSSIDKESKVKKCKRMLDSKYTDHKTFFLPFIHKLLGSFHSSLDLTFVIDGSEVGNGCTALMISIYYKKRGIPICWVVKSCKKGHLPVSLHLEVMNLLAEIIETIPNKITFLGDGEFDHINLQKFCKSKGWSYILRTAKSSIFYNDQGDEFKAKEIYPSFAKEYFSIDQVHFTRQKYGPVHLLIWHSKEYDEAIYLISDLEYGPDIIRYYKRRFSIETIFADIKSRGFKIHKTKMKDAERLNKLLIIVCLGFLITFLFGTYRVVYHEYIPKFIRKDRIEQYSIFQIGFRAIEFFGKRKKYKKILKQFSKDIFKFICVR